MLLQVEAGIPDMLFVIVTERKAHVTRAATYLVGVCGNYIHISVVIGGRANCVLSLLLCLLISFLFCLLSRVDRGQSQRILLTR